VSPVATDGNSAAFNPVYSQGLLYVCIKHFTNPTSGRVVALSAQDGSVQWTQNIPPNPPLGPAACNLKVAIAGDLVVAASDGGKIYAMDRLTGAMRWSAPQLSGLPPGTPGSTDADYRPIVASQGIIIAGSSTGYLVGLDAQSGTERWRATANRGSATYLLAADSDAVYVTYSGLQLGSFAVATGVLRWLAGDNPDGGDFYQTPTPDADKVYVSGVAGFYALRK
jgi:outer membrane protein assembly factor BamB